MGDWVLPVSAAGLALAFYSATGILGCCLGCLSFLNWSLRVSCPAWSLSMAACLVVLRFCRCGSLLAALLTLRQLVLSLWMGFCCGGCGWPLFPLVPRAVVVLGLCVGFAGMLSAAHSHPKVGVAAA